MAYDIDIHYRYQRATPHEHKVLLREGSALPYLIGG